MAKKKGKQKEKKNFVLLKGNKDTEHIFTGAQPRAAALKAASRGFKDIRLRERGTDRIHIFRGERKKVDAPENRPEWMPAKILKPLFKKTGFEHMKKK
jgi:hypothetical protein